MVHIDLYTNKSPSHSACVMYLVKITHDQVESVICDGRLLYKDKSQSTSGL